MNLRALSCLCPLVFAMSAQAEERMLPFGDFEQVVVREIKESGIIGGKTKHIYVVAEGDSIFENSAYDYPSNTIWANSNVWARVMGIHKASCSVYPESRENGQCLRLDTKTEEVKVLGMINVQVLVSGTVYLGEAIEPITSADDPYRNINMGIPFTEKPSALILDYKCLISDCDHVMKYSGIGCGKKIHGVHDEGEFIVYLQRRWEDENGNLYAERIGTLRHRLDHDITDWQNDARFEIRYGNIEGTDYYQPYMALMEDGPFMARNSEGKMKTVHETGWGDASDEPTHIILMLTAGNQGAFIGTVGNTVWVDNVRFEY